MSSIINKVKDALHHDKDTTTTTTGAPGTTTGTTGSSAPEGVAGPHSSRVANAADPRVDSDLDGRAAHHGATGTTGTAGTGLGGATHHHGTTGATTAGTTGTTGFGGTTGTTGTGIGSNTHHHGTTGTTGTTGTGMGSHTHHHGTTGTTGLGGTTTAGPHSSHMANQLDPRVDSTAGGYGSGATGTTGYGSGNTGATGLGSSTVGTTGDRGGLSNSTNAGPHNSNLANTMDPRVDSDLSSTGNRHGAHTHGGILGSSGTHATAGSGTAQNTNGPHNSDLLNKLDPRVDADGDGSKTYGGNKTHS